MPPMSKCISRKSQIYWMKIEMLSGDFFLKLKAKDQYKIIWFGRAGQRESVLQCSHSHA